MQSGPTAQSFGGPVDIQRMIPAADGTDSRAIRLRLAFCYALENFPVITCVDCIINGIQLTLTFN